MSEKYTLDFELPLKEIDDKIQLLLSTSSNTGIDVGDKIEELRDQLTVKTEEVYNNLNRWQVVQLARHPMRPHSSDYIKMITDYWFEIHGDRLFFDDPSIMSGIATIEGVKFCIIAQEKGRNTKDKLYRNFGMPKPEGYRKALRLMKLSEKFNIPILTLIDTPGAYPGIGAEERGQSQAIADNLINMSLLNVPIISLVIGEGASGGALAIGLSDRIICLEYSWYSVISPEGCASILFGDTEKNKEAAESLQLTSKDLYDLNIADRIIDEPLGGIHHDPKTVYADLVNVISTEIKFLKNICKKDLLEQRMTKYNNMGVFSNE